VAGRQKFTRIPKTSELISAGVPTEVIPTYCALADYTNNKTGLCWPKMETLASTLGRSVRTIQRHLHLLKSKGLVEFVERRRNGGQILLLPLQGPPRRYYHRTWASCGESFPI
jgi:DNA-binding transcriptional ArsR family regulator